MRKIGLLVVAIFVSIGVSYAHQPRLVFTYPLGEMISIKNPEISQAFYGNLSGQEDVYQIDSATGFLLYVSIVVPNISGSRTDFTVDIIKWDEAIYSRLDGKRFAWTNFFEAYAGDEYLQWPTSEKFVGPWIYTIRVSNPENMWKYSLAIGKKESFPLNEIIHTYKVLPQLKMVFFEKPWYTIFLNIVWWWLLIGIIVLITVIWGSVKFVKYIKHR